MHAVINVCMKHIYKVIYDLSVDLVIFDLGLPLKELCLINGASYDRSLCEIHIASHVWPFSLRYNMYNI